MVLPTNFNDMKNKTLIATVLGATLAASPLFAAVASAETIAVGAGAGAGAGSGGGSASAQVGASVTSGSGQGTQDQTRDQDRVQDPTTHDGTEPDQDRDRDQTRLYTSTTSTTTAAGAGSMNQERNQGDDNGAGQGMMNQEQYRLQIDPEHIQLRAGSAAQLGQMIQEREQQLNQEAASSTPGNRAALQNANQVRLAVHALLASENLLGSGIGQQVAQIATQIDNSVQATANAEANINARGFWSKLFFGGDAQAAQTIEQEVTQNQARIQELTQLLGTASTSAETKATLQVQLEAMQKEQERLNALAESQKGAWGLFSWRF